jgi:hypothetical protein
VKIYTVGSRVIAQLNDGRKMVAVVSAIHETTSGRKVSITSGCLALKIDAERIVKVLK